MKKMIPLLLFLPALCLGQFDSHKNIPRIDWDNTWTGSNSFLGDVTMTYIEVDSVVIVYENSTFVDADSLLVQGSGKIKFSDDNDYFQESSDGILKLYLGGTDIFNFTGAAVSLARGYNMFFGHTRSSATDFNIKCSTLDGNANCLMFVSPEGGAVDVPVYVFGDASIAAADLGWFNGITEPRIVVPDDDIDSWIALGFQSDDAAALITGGSAKRVIMPNMLTLQLKTIAAGDSVFLNTLVDAADTTLKVYNGTTWVAVQDLTP